MGLGGKLKAINKKRILLFLILLLFVLSIAYQGLRHSLRGEYQPTLPVSEQLQSHVDSNISAECAERIDSGINSGNDRQDSIEHSLTQRTIPKVVDVKRNQTWEKTLKDINSKLLRCHDWFDTVQVLSTWLYQNTRVGNVYKYNINRVIPKHYVLLRLDLKYLYELNNSDSVAGTCGFHSYYALLLYHHYGIKSYLFSMRQNPMRIKSGEGHMINILENPHDHKWYPVDNFYGIRYRYHGEWLDMEKYFQLCKEKQLCEVSTETFGTFKVHVHDYSSLPFDSVDLDNNEIISVERSKDRNYFRIVAPYTLRRQFSQQFIKVLFDSIAASYGQPPHVDWMDLARRMPMYGTRIFPLVDLKEQAYADILLSSWKRYPLEFQNCPTRVDNR